MWWSKQGIHKEMKKFSELNPGEEFRFTWDRSTICVKIDDKFYYKKDYSVYVEIHEYVYFCRNVDQIVLVI